MSTLTEPAATAPAVELADYLELRALQSADRSASVHDLMSDLTRSGTLEVLDAHSVDEEGLADPDEEVGLVDPGGEVAENLGQTAISEIDARIVACGGAYPFTLDAQGVVSLKRNAVGTPYVFMLLLTRFGGKAGPTGTDGTKIFEDLSAVAAAEYFGWVDDHLLVYPFGFPRRLTPAGFERALNGLCERLGEGQGTKARPNLSDQQDATLDLVVARRFPDGRVGQLIGFGQCATGKNWRGKINDLRPEKFCNLWMLDTPAVIPVPMFFVPHTIEERIWLHTATHAGVLFDRCRLAYYTTPLDRSEPVRTSLRDWSRAVFDAKVKA